MKLDSVANVRADIGFDDIDTVNDVLAQGLEAATVTLESLLRQPTFALGARSDAFQVRQMNRYAHTREVTLNLSHGFLTAADITITHQLVDELMGGTAHDLDASYYDLDREKGRILIRQKDLSGQQVNVSYTTGYDDAGSDGEYDATPDWLKTAARKLAIITMDQLSPTMRHDDNAAAERAISEMRKELSTLVDPHIRYFAGGLHPYGR